MGKAVACLVALVAGVIVAGWVVSSLLGGLLYYLIVGALVVGGGLWLYSRVMFGPLTKPALQGIPDLDRRELLILAPLVLLVIYYGVQPNPILNAFDASTTKLLGQVQAALAVVKTAAIAP